jgi:outer membrane beta-barrel protein
MRLQLLTALLFCSTAIAQVTQDEDDEDVAPKPAPAQEAAPAATPSAKDATTPTDAPTIGATTSDPREQELVSGAPLYNPNVAVHIVEKKVFSDRRRHELVLYPAAVQVNGKFTQHIGSSLSYLYHLHENFAFQVSGQYNWVTSESAFNQELIDKVKEEPEAATSLLLVWATQAGVEVTPLYGKFAFYEGTLVHFSIVLNGGAGVGSTKHQLKPYNQTTGAATYGGTGLKFLGELGGGFRLQVGNRFALRLEVRDLVYTARVDSVNGCNLSDLTALRGNLNAGVSSTCVVNAFNPDTTLIDVSIAQGLVRKPTSDVLNNVGFYAGFGWIF